MNMYFLNFERKSTFKHIQY